MKIITSRDDTYHLLLTLKDDEDSFSEVINRLIRKKNHDIRGYAGALRDSKVLDRLLVSTRQMRDSGMARL